MRELCALLAQPQPLVSYHLALLHAERVVERRRSALDGREFYYLLNLERCHELLAESGSALHPGLLSAQRAPAAGRAERDRPARVLFLCTGNSARSQIAEALVARLSAETVDVTSAGTHPKPLHRQRRSRVMRERGIDVSGHPDQSTCPNLRGRASTT